MEISGVLKGFKLKSTPCRSEILHLLCAHEQAFSHADIENQLATTHDRVTIYRTLKTFLNKGIIHKVLDDEGVTKYAMCTACSREEHHHEHVHFKCERCGQTQCLENIKIPELSLPEGFRAKEKNLLIQGLCDLCVDL